jgi:predicted metal-binding protein
MINTVHIVSPVIDYSVRNLCRMPYHNHPKGCPNYFKNVACPPQAPLICKAIDLTKNVYLIYNKFDLGAHVDRMSKRHPQWSQRQLECCLYWQGTARKQLREKVRNFIDDNKSLRELYVPEACGVNITATMMLIGIELEWPPKTVTYQIALIGTKA